MVNPCSAIKNYFINIYQRLFVKKIKILFIGLPSSGKSKTISALFDNTYENVNNKGKIMIKKHDFKNFIFFSYDIPGTPEFINKWDHYYKKTDLLIFVVDSTSNDDEIKKAKDELQGLLYRNTWLQRALLVLCSKNDQEGSMSCRDAILKLDLISLQNRDVSCFSVSAKNGTNLNMVIDWIEEQAKLI